jgi:hypothetical protein
MTLTRSKNSHFKQRAEVEEQQHVEEAASEHVPW